MARQYAVDDSEWREVMIINGYALFMGYLMMGVRGLGLLVITWTTVVRLAGSVSGLGKKDFWCLTGIMLIQTAGVFNFLLKEKISDTVHSWWGLVYTVSATLFKDKAGIGGRKRLVIFYVLVVIQVLVFGVILCALAVVYMLGIYTSAGLSLWRLIEHDFGDAGGANQRPALLVLYILAVAQGVLFGYKTIYALVTRNRLVEMFSKVDKVEEYIEETVTGCEKDPSFATGRNFVTYGVDLMMEAQSSEGFIAGIKVLGGAFSFNDNNRYLESGRKVLAKYLLTRSSDSSSAIIQRLLDTVGHRSPYSREIKEHVVRILDIVAPCIRLEQFPRAIECLCSVVHTSEEPNNKLQGNHTDDDESRGYGNRFKDYERVEVLEEYEKQYVEGNHEFVSPGCSFLLDPLIACLPYQCFLCITGLHERFVMRKMKGMENQVEENIRTNGFDQLLLIAANIICKLVADEGNRWIMRTYVSNTMIHKVAIFPTKLHRKNHYPCRAYQKSELQMLEQCWVLTEQLLVALQPASTPVGEGRKRRRNEEIQVEEEREQQLLVLWSTDGSAFGSSIKRTIKDSIESTIKCIFDCLDCSATQKRQAIQILLHLSLDMSFIIKNSESSKRRLSWILVLIIYSNDDSKYWMVPSLTYRNKNCCDFAGIRRKASEKLLDIHSEESARESRSIHLAIRDLESAFYDGAQDISIRTHAIIIMEGLCRLDNHSRLFELDRFLFDAIPEVVNKTLILCGFITAERLEQATDDMEKDNVSQDNQDRCVDTERLRNALVSLCNYISNSTMFMEIASKTCEEQGKSFEDFKCLLRKSI